MKKNKYKALILFVILFVIFTGCSKLCRVKYEINEGESNLTSWDYNITAIQDSIISFSCGNSEEPEGEINPGIALRFVTSKVYNIDSLDIHIKLDDNTSLNLVGWKCPYISFSRYIKFNKNQLNIQKIIETWPRKTNAKYSYKRDPKECEYCIEFSPYKRYNKFIIVKIKAILTNQNEKIRYEKEFKLYQKIYCYYD